MAFSILLFTFLISYATAADLSTYEMDRLCSGKNMEVIAHPSDETKFLVCINDKSQLGVCRTIPDPADPSTLQQTCFDEKKQTCDLSFCSGSGGSAQPDDYFDFVKNYCENIKNFKQLIPGKECENYYMCLMEPNDPLLITCPNGYHFSRVTKSCEPPLEAGCQSLNTMCEDKPTGYRFVSTNCYDYYECLRSKPIPKSCPYGEHYSFENKKCIPASNSKCVEKSNRLPKCTPSDNGLYFPHSKCDRFYVCVNTVPLEAQCPEDYYFDSKAQLCKKDTKGFCQTD